MKLQRQWYKICVRTCSGELLEICWELPFLCFWAKYSERISLILKIVSLWNGFFFSLRLLYWWNVESLSFVIMKTSLFILTCEEKNFPRTSHPPKNTAGKSAAHFTPQGCQIGSFGAKNQKFEKQFLATVWLFCNFFFRHIFLGEKLRVVRGTYPRHQIIKFSTFIRWRHRAYSSMVQLFRKRSHSQICSFRNISENDNLLVLFML